MYLPPSVLYCIHTLENAGFRAYAVGGCVRDALLGLTPQDYDLCTDAPPETTAELFSAHTLVRSGQKHGTIGVVVDNVVYEITTFRTEGGYSDGRHPDSVAFVGRVEEDLARRDFTVNAMAYHPKTGLADPWGGQEDLKNRILRTVGDPVTRFREDALRILRGVRFAVRYGLQPEPATRQAMESLAPTMDRLARERVFDELCKLLPLLKAQDMLTFAPVITQAVPVLKPCVGFEQHTPHHRYDVYTHTAHVVQNTSGDLVLRWAALLHDVGKPHVFTMDENGRGHFKGHAGVSAQLAEQTLLELKAPTALRQQVIFLIEHHMLPLEPDRRLLRRRMGKFGIHGLTQLIALQQADKAGKGVDEDSGDILSQVEQQLVLLQQEAQVLCTKDLAVDGRDLMALGYRSGPELGKKLQWLLEQVQEERLPNEKQALLDACKEETL